MLLNDVSVDVTDRAFPSFRWAIDQVYGVEGIRVFLLQGVKFFTEEDVLFGDIGVDELEFGLVVLVRKGMGDELVERGAADL